MKSEREVKSKTLNRVLLNPSLRRVAILILSTPLITSNPIYKYVYRRQINRAIQAHLEKPLIVQLEPSSFCNLHCGNCPSVNLQRKKGFMDMKVYEKVIDGCIALGVNNVFLSGVGEPILNKLLADQVTYAKTQGIRTLDLYTNATLLTPQLSKRLIQAGLDRLKVSVDAATNETYSKMRPPGNLEVVEENLRTLIRLKREMKSSKPQVTVKFIKESRNANEVSLFKRKWRNLADEVYIGFLHNWGGTLTRKGLEWRGGLVRDPCSLVFRMLNVCWDGRVSLCCLDSEAEVVVGDIKETSIREIWRSPKLQTIRQAHLDGHLDRIPLCAKCSMRDVWWIY